MAEDVDAGAPSHFGLPQFDGLPEHPDAFQMNVRCFLLGGDSDMPDFEIRQRSFNNGDSLIIDTWHSSSHS
jgi:hypothetical protein